MKSSRGAPAKERKLRRHLCKCGCPLPQPTLQNEKAQEPHALPCPNPPGLSSSSENAHRTEAQAGCYDFFPELHYPFLRLWREHSPQTPQSLELPLPTRSLSSFLSHIAGSGTEGFEGAPPLPHTLLRFPATAAVLQSQGWRILATPGCASRTEMWKALAVGSLLPCHPILLTRLDYWTESHN